MTSVVPIGITPAVAEDPAAQAQALARLLLERARRRGSDALERPLDFRSAEAGARTLQSNAQAWRVLVAALAEADRGTLETLAGLIANELGVRSPLAHAVRTAREPKREPQATEPRAGDGADRYRAPKAPVSRESDRRPLPPTPQLDSSRLAANLTQSPTRLARTVETLAAASGWMQRLASDALRRGDAVTGARLREAGSRVARAVALARQAPAATREIADAVAAALSELAGVAAHVTPGDREAFQRDLAGLRDVAAQSPVSSELQERSTRAFMALREQMSLVMNSMLAEHAEFWNPGEVASDRWLRSDTLHAGLRWMTASWTVHRDLRAGRLTPADFGKRSWDEVQGGDLHQLAMQRIDRGELDFAAETRAMLAATGPLRVQDPQRGVIDLSPDTIDWGSRSIDMVLDSRRGARMLANTTVGRAMVDASSAAFAAGDDAGADAARLRGRMRTTEALYRGSPADSGRRLQPDASQATLVLAQTAGVLPYRLEPVAADDAARRALEERQRKGEIAGVMPARGADGQMRLVAVVPLTPREVARAARRLLDGGELAHLDEATRRMLESMTGPANDPGAALATRVDEQAESREIRRIVGAATQMGMLSVVSLGVGSTVGAALSVAQAGRFWTAVGPLVAQSSSFTAMNQAASGRFSVWDYPIDLAMLGLLYPAARLARSFQGTTAGERVISQFAAAGITTTSAAFAGTAIATLEHVSRHGDFPRAREIRDMFLTNLGTALLLHTVNTGAQRLQPGLHLSPVRAELETLRGRAGAEQTRLEATTREILRLDAEMARLRERGATDSDPRLVALAGRTLEAMDRYNGQAAGVTRVVDDFLAFADRHAPADAAQMRATLGRGRAGPEDEVPMARRIGIDSATPEGGQLIGNIIGWRPRRAEFLRDSNEVLDRTPGLEVSINRAYLFHGSNSASLLMLTPFGAGTGGLYATGRLPYVPFTGEMRVGAMVIPGVGTGINITKLSTVPLRNIDVANDYSRNDGFVRWTPEIGRANLARYGQERGAGEDYFRALMQRERARLEQWERLNDTERQLVAEGFPIVYGMRPPADKVHRADGTDIGEVGVVGGVPFAQITAMMVPRERIAFVRELLRARGITHVRVSALEDLPARRPISR
ncbi:MAG: hypothetical protein ACAI38_06495 [Myxococcota bacterium]